MRSSSCFRCLRSPPPGLDLDRIEDLPAYLRKLCKWVLKLPKNGVRKTANHCWWIISGMFPIPMQASSYVPIGLCHRTKHFKRTEWKNLPSRLAISHKKIINWCPTIPFPDPKEGVYPKDRGVQKTMIWMFFNPDPSLRLRLVPLIGV